MRYLPRVPSSPSAERSGGNTATGSTDTSGAWSTFPRSSSARARSDALPVIETVQPRRGFPKLLGSTSGSAAGMGPSAARLSRSSPTRGVNEDGAPGEARRAREAPAVGQRAENDGRLDSDSLSTRYRRGAAGRDSDGPTTRPGPGVGRVGRNDATPTRPTRDGRELASPTTPKTRPAPPARSVEPRSPTATAPAKGTTLRERAMANPKRTRDFLARNSPVGSAASAAFSIGLNYGFGWPGCGGGIPSGCWDDGFLFWFDWCSGGSYSWGYQCHPYGWWYYNYWNCWPYGSSYWWWSSWYYPYYYYPPYPSSVVVYQEPSQVIYVEQAPSYDETAPVGEGVIDDSVEGGSPVDDSMDRLMSPAASAASRAATQNLTLGDNAFRAGRYGDAVHFYAKAIEFQPDQGVLYLVLSDALFATGDYHYGAYALRKALELDPGLLDEAIDKHGFYSDPAEFDRQLAVLETYLRDRPTDQDARLLLAANYLFGLRPAAAVDLIEAPASESLRKTSTGLMLLEAARRQQYDAAKGVLTK